MEGVEGVARQLLKEHLSQASQAGARAAKPLLVATEPLREVDIPLEDVHGLRDQRSYPVSEDLKVLSYLLVGQVRWYIGGHHVFVKGLVQSTQSKPGLW